MNDAFVRYTTLIMLILINTSIFFALYGCINSNEARLIWDERSQTKEIGIKQGIPVYEESNVDYKRNGDIILKIKLDEPVIVSIASKPEEWGFFQFPSIYRSQDNGELVAKWNMATDAVESYGKGGHGFAISRDGGKIWTSIGGELPVGGGLLLPNGEQIQIYTPPALKVEELQLPKPLSNKGTTLYKLSEIPEVLQGMYLKRLAKGETSWTTEHELVEDPQAVRYTISGMFPLVWWGDLRIASDSSIIAGIYPGFYLNEKGNVDPSGVLFYRSTDGGRKWKIRGRIPYEYNLEKDPNGDKRLSTGFTEPGFEILLDGTFLCVMRTSDGYGNSPMYITRSVDDGITWLRPKSLTSAGVLPRLLQLENGVIVLASGRPGVQLRFSTDGKGEKWTDSFEMFPFENENETVSCGYTELLATGPDRFLLIYSDFKYRNEVGTIRKAIKVREVIVTPK